MTGQPRPFVSLAVDNTASDRAAQAEALRIAEAILFAGPEPISAAEIAGRLPGSVDVDAVLSDLQRLYAGRGVNLVAIEGKWTFRTAPDLSYALAQDVPEPQRLSRAAMEVLAIVAYHQPTTRAEIEDIRGVSTSKGTLDALLETRWIRMRGRRKSPGRPVTFGTTPDFLRHFGLNAITDLPGLDELHGLGLLEGKLPSDLGVLTPTDSVLLADDEEPLEPELISFSATSSEGAEG